MECGWFMVAMLSLSFPAGASKSAGSGDVAAIERLLDFSTEPSAKSLKSLEHVYRTLRAATRKRPPVQYAYAVALIRQKRFQEASRVLYELVEEQPADPALWRARISLELELS
jgi:predicted Zn-dependent protease